MWSSQVVVHARIPPTGGRLPVPACRAPWAGGVRPSWVRPPAHPRVEECQQQLSVSARGLRWFGGGETSSAAVTTEEGLNWWEKGKDVWMEASSEQELAEMVAASDKPVVVDWFATWCHGCEKSYPEVTKVAGDAELRKKFTFIKACVENMQSFSRAQGITSLPRISVYLPGEALQPAVSIDVPVSRVKHLRTNLAVVVGNPGMAYTLDPNGFVIPVAKSAAAIAEEEKAKAVAEMERGTAGLREHLEAVANSKKKASAATPAPGTSASGSPTEWPASLGLGPEYERAKQAFLERFGDRYGYDGRIDTLYPAEVGVRMKPNEHYLDYTGSSVYTKSMIAAVMEDLQTHMFGNPHSQNPSSELSSERIDDVRLQMLKFFNADPKKYTLVFTRSATGALKMVGETFPWTVGSTFRYLRENHNSVLGIREYAHEHGANFEAVTEDQVEAWLQDGDNEPVVRAPPKDGGPAYSLFAFPGEDNFAGVIYPCARWVTGVQAKSTPDHRWLTLVDAAAYAANTPLDLREMPADFVDVTAYKMWGYPTGLGALIVRTDVVPLLRKVFWGGGTVALATANDDFHVLKCKPSDKLEDGTVNFLDIISLRHGMDVIRGLGGVGRVHAHTRALVRWAHEELSALRHANGEPILQIFGKHGLPNADDVQGPILNFEVLSPDGRVLSYKTFESEAASAGFHVRTGAECNPGACYAYLGVSDEEIESLAGVKEGCDDGVEFVRVQRPAKGSSAGGSSLDESAVDIGHPAEVALEWVDVPLGSVRISLGYMSTFEDVWSFARFVESNYKDRRL